MIRWKALLTILLAGVMMVGDASAQRLGGKATPVKLPPEPPEEEAGEEEGPGEEGGEESGGEDGGEGEGEGGEGGDEQAGGEDGGDGGDGGDEPTEVPTEVIWTPVVGMDGHVFPSFIIASSTMKQEAKDEENSGLIGDANGMFGAFVIPIKDNSEAEVTVTCDKIMEPSKLKHKLWQAGAEFQMMPKIRYKYDALMAVKQQTPVNVVIKVEVDGKAIGEEVRTLTLRSINDCPFGLVEKKKKVNDEGEEETEDVEVDLSFTFAGYVNENHPYIDELLKEALKSGLVDSFDGYQSGEISKVMMQVYSVWKVLHGQGVKYSSVTSSPAASEVVYSQHVRFMDEVQKASQANCADGSVLFASVLRKIGLDACLVKIPGHMYVALVLDQKGESVAGLETTMIGSKDPGECELELVDEETRKKHKQDPAFKTFSAAVCAGNGELAEAVAKSNEGEAGYLFLNISKSRRMGIMPIAR